MFPSSSTPPAEVGGYQLPNFLRSEEDLQRLCHSDIPGMSANDLWVEHFRVQRALEASYGLRIYVGTTGPEHSIPADEWLRQRLEVLEAAERKWRGRRSA